MRQLSVISRNLCYAGEINARGVDEWIGVVFRGQQKQVCRRSKYAFTREEGWAIEGVDHIEGAVGGEVHAVWQIEPQGSGSTPIRRQINGCLEKQSLVDFQIR